MYVEPFCKMYCLCVKCAASAMWRCNWLQRIDGWIFISTFLSALTLVLYHLYIVQIQIQRQRQSKLNLQIDLRCLDHLVHCCSACMSDALTYGRGAQSSYYIHTDEMIVYKQDWKQTERRSISNFTFPFCFHWQSS